MMQAAPRQLYQINSTVLDISAEFPVSEMHEAKEPSGQIRLGRDEVLSEISWRL
jgi:hypothetical protein